MLLTNSEEAKEYNRWLEAHEEYMKELKRKAKEGGYILPKEYFRLKLKYGA